MNFDPKKNYYATLEINEDASQDDIKKAFRKLALKHHPDKKGGDQATFQEINEAHQTLSDEKERQQYDAYRKWWFSGNGQWWFWDAGFGWFGWFDIWDIFSWFGWGGQTRSRRWRDLQYDMTITFEESFLGKEQKISYRRLVPADGITTKTCPTCQWRWAVMQQVRTPLWVMQTQAACPACAWTWVSYEKDGKKVESGLEKKEKTVTVKIPAWIKDTTMIKYTWMGDAGVAGDDGDLYVKIHIQRSDIYIRKNNDLHVTASVSLFDMVLGWTQKIPHPEGDITIKIPKWTQANSLIKVGGKWFGEKWIFSNRGDMYVKPYLSIPKKLSKEQEKLRKELQWLS